MTLKAGDKVWVPETVVETPLLFMDRSKEMVWFQFDKDERWWLKVGDVIPDIPNLAQIARYLAAHPETVDALELCHEWLNGIDVPLPDDLCEAATRLLELRDAMRGEGSDDER